MPCRELRFVLSVVFYVVNENPQNRIRSKSCKSKRKHQKSANFWCCPVRWPQSGYFALESLHRNGLQISGKKYSQFF